ncbi:MAG: hypothetical protein IIC74_00875, partial [Bacteroidetes bacterium]|nr:hypothetical protein [Bacteroidota bacterium]
YEVDRDDGSYLFLNATIISAAYAIPLSPNNQKMVVPPNPKLAYAFKELYLEAKEEKRGLWKDEKVFESTVTPVKFDLTNLVPGWNRVMPEFNIAESFIENGDGTISFANAGVGVMFLPSGLAFFADSPPGVPLYSNVIFKFELYQSEVNDHDLDGVPSYLEDLNGNLNLNDDDTDANTLPNYFDPDDDGDGVLTINELEPKEYTVDTNIGETEPIFAEKEFEISRSESLGIITIKTVTIVDSNNDGLDDYLDENITINYNEEG